MHAGKVSPFHIYLPWLVISGAPLLYWMMSRQITGPAYLMDEIGYLANAAFLGGHVIDGASSYHAGYSLFLSPLFRFFSNPAYVWRGAMVINAFLWFCSFVLLYRLLCDLLPESTVYDKTFALLCTALYPSWAIMSGYVFTTTCFTFVFMCSLYALVLWKDKNVLSLLPHSLCVGFLFWVHPTGGAVCVASFLAVACVCLSERKYSIILVHTALLLAMVLTYKLGVHKWLAVSMTPENLQPGNHYKSLNSMFSMLLNIDYWIRFFLLVVGHATSAIVSTFGLAVSGILSFIYISDKKIKIFSNKFAVAIFVSLSFLCILLLGAASFSFGKVRIDQLIYSRYFDPTLFPLISFGILYSTKIKTVFYNMILILLFGFITINYIQNVVKTNVLINTISFWPQYIVKNINFILYVVLGSIGIIASFVLKKYFRKALILIFISIFLICTYKQMLWHKNILASYSAPTSIVKIIHENVKFNSCIGFDINSAIKISFFHYERYGLNSFYLFNYKYRRMSPNKWLSGCDGPFLTFDIKKFENIPDIDVVAREKMSGLYLVFKKKRDEIVIPESIARKSDIDIIPRDNRETFSSLCFDMKASELARFRQAGWLEGDHLASDNRRGFLFFGPYKRLNKGRYNIVLSGEFYENNGVVLDVVSNQGNKKHASCILKDLLYKNSSEITISFILNDDVDDIEIRLFVTKESSVVINGYKILKINNIYSVGMI